jgi:hypothetical protein
LACYTAFGLNICSELELTGWLTGRNACDLFVRVGTIPSQARAQSLPGLAGGSPYLKCLLSFDGVADYLVSDGSEILVEPRPGSEPDAVQLFLGSAFGALLFQRGLFPLHASAAATPKGAILFAGIRGSGKSTLAAAFHAAGYPLVADELCATAGPLVFPANPFATLWRDSLEALGKRPSDGWPVRRDADKFIVPVTTGFPDGPMPIHSIYTMEIGASLELAPLEGLSRISALCRTTYGWHFVRQMNLDRQHLTKVCELSKQTRMARITRPAGVFCINELVEMVQRDLGF